MSSGDLPTPDVRSQVTLDTAAAWRRSTTCPGCGESKLPVRLLCKGCLGRVGPELAECLRSRDESLYLECFVTALIELGVRWLPSLRPPALWVVKRSRPLPVPSLRRAIQSTICPGCGEPKAPAEQLVCESCLSVFDAARGQRLSEANQRRYGRPAAISARLQQEQMEAREALNAARARTDPMLAADRLHSRMLAAGRRFYHLEEEPPPKEEA